MVELLGTYQVPLRTSAVRVLLTASGRAATAERLSALAGYERLDYERTRMPPRLCSAVAPDGQAVTPRWWALGTWRLARRVLTPEAKTIWVAVAAERLCRHLAEQGSPVDETVSSLAIGMVAEVVPDRYFEVPEAGDDWWQLRDLLIQRRPAVLHGLDSPTPGQHEAEDALRGSELSPLELYFGRRATPAGT